MKAMPTGQHYGGLKLQDEFLTQAGGVRQIAGRTADSSDQAVVGIHPHGDLMGSVSHGYRSFASATSQASRQSGQ